MKKLIGLIFLFLILIACSQPYKGPTARTKKHARKGAPSGKFSNPTLFSRINPFQGRAKAKLNKSKRKKLRFLKRRRTQGGTFRKGKKPGRSFGMKRTVDKGRLKSSGSRSKSKGSGNSRRKNKDLFNTRKK